MARCAVARSSERRAEHRPAHMSAAPSIARRRERRCILLSADPMLRTAVEAALPSDWALSAATALEEVGGFADVLLHRFVLLDLDAAGGVDAAAELERLRGEWMLNVPVFCLGGEAQARDAARLARADRFFERDALGVQLPALCEAFAW